MSVGRPTRALLEHTGPDRRCRRRWQGTAGWCARQAAASMVPCCGQGWPMPLGRQVSQRAWVAVELRVCLSRRAPHQGRTWLGWEAAHVRSLASSLTKDGPGWHGSEVRNAYTATRGTETLAQVLVAHVITYLSGKWALTPSPRTPLRPPTTATRRRRPPSCPCPRTRRRSPPPRGARRRRGRRPSGAPW